MSEQKNNQTVSAPDPLGMGELAQRSALQPRIESVESPDGVRGQYAVIPSIDPTGRFSVKLESVAKFCDEYRERPRRRTGQANLADLDSLIAHVNRFKDGDSVIFADTDRGHPSLTAVLDYHCQGSAGAPRFGQHRSKYAFPVSNEWTTWTKNNGIEMSQADFAEFIEANIVDVVEYSENFKSAAAFAEACGLTFAKPAQILELSRGLSVNVEGKLATSVNLQNGLKQIQFTESHTGENGALLKVPGAFLIGIPVFRSEARYQVCVRLRYRKQGPSLVWLMDLWRHEEVFDAAIRDACEMVGSETGLPLLVGTPE